MGSSLCSTKRTWVVLVSALKCKVLRSGPAALLFRHRSGSLVERLAAYSQRRQRKLHTKKKELPPSVADGRMNKFCVYSSWTRAGTGLAVMLVNKSAGYVIRPQGLLD